MYNKENGVYYTPSALAEYLTEPLVTEIGQSILDPSYGEGALLLAAERIHLKKNKNNIIRLFGCDTKPINGLLTHLPEANLREVDFFNYSTDNKFQTILMNPPYVRHHILDSEKIETYRSQYPALKILNNNADLWAYFLIKAVDHLEKNGSIGAILPWSFLQADYSEKLRLWLSERFIEIRALALTESYFDKADVRIVLLWLKSYGNKCESIAMGSAQKLDANISYTTLPQSNWVSNKVLYNGNTDTETILSRLKTEFGFAEFENHATVRIGIVTGADKFFIVTRAKATELGFSSRHLVPIISSSKDFPLILQGDMKNAKRLIRLSKRTGEKFKSYIKKGVEEKYHLRAHSELREPWFSVNVGAMPDAFFPYRSAHTPYLVLNEVGAQCTNSIHRIYFKKLSRTEKRWIQVSLLSVIGQLSIEAYSKTYGRGVLKIEPKSLKKSLVLKRKDKSINEIYPLIKNAMLENDKETAMNLATDFINRELGIPMDLADLAKKALLDFRSHRIAKTIVPE